MIKSATSASATMAPRRPEGRPLLLLPAILALLLLAGNVQTAPLRNADGSCVVFPPGSAWHKDVSKWPVYAGSRSVVASIGPTTRFHADFGGGELVDGKMTY